MNRKFVVAISLIVAAIIVGLLVFNPIVNENSAMNGTPIAQVTVPALDPLAIEGETLFNSYCAKCHGVNAAGNDGAGPPLVHVLYVAGHHGDAAFYLAAKNGVRAHHWPFGNMPPVADVTEDEIAKIVVYIRALQRANAIN